MRASTLRRFESDIKKEKKALDKIECEVMDLKERLLERRPEHFGRQDVVNAFFGALIVCLTFVFKGSLLTIGTRISYAHIAAIIIGTSLILTGQIYFIGYNRVKDKSSRKFGQFWAKRFFTLYIISFIVSSYLIYIFGVNRFIGDIPGIMKLIVVMSMPGAVGAAIPSLMRKY